MPTSTVHGSPGHVAAARWYSASQVGGMDPTARPDGGPPAARSLEVWLPDSSPPGGAVPVTAPASTAAPKVALTSRTATSSATRLMAQGPHRTSRLHSIIHAMLCTVIARHTAPPVQRPPAHLGRPIPRQGEECRAG